jgi:hypothetical protein
VRICASSKLSIGCCDDRPKRAPQAIDGQEAGRFFGRGFLVGLMIGGGICFFGPGAPAAVVLIALPFVAGGLAYDWRLRRLIRKQRTTVVAN